MLLLPLVWLVLALLGVFVAVKLWTWVVGAIVGAIVLAVIIWVFVSTLSPAIPDRTCPGCGREGLYKVRRGEPGVRCEHCAYHDESMHVAYLDEF